MKHEMSFKNDPNCHTWDRTNSAKIEDFVETLPEGLQWVYQPLISLINGGYNRGSGSKAGSLNGIVIDTETNELLLNMADTGGYSLEDAERHPCPFIGGRNLAHSLAELEDWSLEKYGVSRVKFGTPFPKLGWIRQVYADAPDIVGIDSRVGSVIVQPKDKVPYMTASLGELPLSDLHKDALSKISEIRRDYEAVSDARWDLEKVLAELRGLSHFDVDYIRDSVKTDFEFDDAASRIESILALQARSEKIGSSVYAEESKAVRAITESIVRDNMNQAMHDEIMGFLGHVSSGLSEYKAKVDEHLGALLNSGSIRLTFKDSKLAREILYAGLSQLEFDNDVRDTGFRYGNDSLRLNMHSVSSAYKNRSSAEDLLARAEYIGEQISMHEKHNDEYRGGYQFTVIHEDRDYAKGTFKTTYAEVRYAPAKIQEKRFRKPVVLEPAHIEINGNPELAGNIARAIMKAGTVIYS